MSRLFISRITLVFLIFLQASCVEVATKDEDANEIDNTAPPSASNTDPVTPDPVTPDPVTPDPVTPDPVTPDPVIPDPITPDPITPDPVTPDPVTPDPITPDPVTPDPVIPDPVTPDPVIPDTEKQIPISIAYNGWSTMLNSLDGQNTESSNSPSASHDPSLFNLVGEMYRANDISGYTSDFSFLTQGSKYIDGTEALNNISTTSASVIVLSAYGGGSGILEDPSNAAASGGWINRMVNAAEAAQSRAIIPIMFQAWGSSGTEGAFHNAKINSDTLQERLGILVVRTGEIVEALNQLNSSYTTNTNAPGGKYVPPVKHLFSGDTNDNFHGSYAMAYVNALATFKCLTGISAANNAFIIPSGGAAGEQYGMSQDFINDIIQTVDKIQKESLISGLEEGAMPIASDFSFGVSHGIESLINVSKESNLLDDAAIILENFTLKTFDASHFSNVELTQHQLIITPSNSFIGETEIVIGYTDSQEQSIEIIISIEVTAEVKAENQEIIIGFGDGNWSSFGSSANLYNHTVTAGGKVINGIRGFNEKTTQGNLQDTEGTGVGSVTAITSGNLSGPGYTANDSPVVSDYGPYSELYASLSAAPKGSTVSFSINGLDSNASYRINMAGRYVDDTTNLVSVDVNGVTGRYDSSRSSANDSEFEQIVSTNNSGQLIITLSSDGSSTATRWGLSYVHINRITD